jgi:hypothetical protein
MNEHSFAEVSVQGDQIRHKRYEGPTPSIVGRTAVLILGMTNRTLVFARDNGHIRRLMERYGKQSVRVLGRVKQDWRVK